MTRDEAVQVIVTTPFWERFTEDEREAMSMAIEALEQYEMAYEHGWTAAESEYRKILERKCGSDMRKILPKP